MESVPGPSCENHQLLRDSVFANNDSDIESEDELVSDFEDFVPSFTVDPYINEGFEWTGDSFFVYMKWVVFEPKENSL